MDKQKQIEEMAKDICNMCRDMYGVCDNKEELCPAIKAEMEYLYNAGYRKIPEGAVVLTREEAEQVCGTVKAHGELLKDLQEAKSVFEKEMEEAQKEFVKRLEEDEKEIRKETAEKLINELLDFLGSRQMFSIIDGEHKTLIELSPLWKKVVELAKENGVEVKD